MVRPSYHVSARCLAAQAAGGWAAWQCVRCPGAAGGEQYTSMPAAGSWSLPPWA